MPERMRVLQVIHGFNMGGAETLVRDYLLYMSSCGIDCKALCYEDCEASYIPLLRNAGIPVVNLADTLPGWIKKAGKAGRPAWYIYTYLGIRKAIREWRPDVIHTHLGVNRFVRFAVGRKPFIGHNGEHSRFFHTVHNEPKMLWLNDSLSARNRQKQRLELNASKTLVREQGMRFIALHDRMRKELNELFDVEDTVVVNNGIDFSRFENPRSRKDARTELGIPEDAFVIGHVGRFSDQKNHRKIVSVFEEVSKRKENAFLLLVGDGELKESVQQEITRKGLKSLILSNRSDIPDLMNAMDVFLFPSLYEGLGVVLIEAQRMKLPCVISATVPEFAVISNLVRIEQLEADDSVWANNILEPFPSDIIYDHIEEWDMKIVVSHLLRLYRGEE